MTLLDQWHTKRNRSSYTPLQSQVYWRWEIKQQTEDKSQLPAFLNQFLNFQIKFKSYLNQKWLKAGEQLKMQD